MSADVPGHHLTSAYKNHRSKFVRLYTPVFDRFGVPVVSQNGGSGILADSVFRPSAVPRGVAETDTSPRRCLGSGTPGYDTAAAGGGKATASRLAGSRSTHLPDVDRPAPAARQGRVRVNEHTDQRRVPGVLKAAQLGADFFANWSSRRIQL